MTSVPQRSLPGPLRFTISGNYLDMDIRGSTSMLYGSVAERLCLIPCCVQLNHGCLRVVYPCRVICKLEVSDRPLKRLLKGARWQIGSLPADKDHCGLNSNGVCSESV